MSNFTDEQIELLINKYSKLLFNISYSYLRDSFYSEDIVQETFIKLYNSYKTFNDENHIKNWLIRVVINKSINELKRIKKVIISYDDSIYKYKEDNFLEEKKTYVYESICLLRNNYKTVIILYYYDDLSIKEISNILKISEGNVSVRLKRAREKLKEIILKRSDYGQ